MKKIVTLLIMLIGFAALSQVSLKGFTLGEKTTETSPKQTTVEGYDGEITVFTLQDGRIYSLIFHSDNTANFSKVLTQVKIEQLIKGVESHYQVELELKDDELYDYWSAEKDGNTIFISVHDFDDFLTFDLIISNDKLKELRREEIKSDF